MSTLEVAKKYFEYSNQSNFNQIKTLLTKSSTYSSQSTGLYLGTDSIIEMQMSFHGSFERLEWKVIDMKEEKPGIICVDFIFIGIKDGEEIKFSGIEYILVADNRIQHIEIRNK